jgi:hypothetical protein
VDSSAHWKAGFVLGYLNAFWRACINMDKSGKPDFLDKDLRDISPAEFNKFRDQVERLHGELVELKKEKDRKSFILFSCLCLVSGAFIAG